MEQDDVRCILAQRMRNDMLVTDIYSIHATLEEHLKGENYIIPIQICHPEFLVIEGTQSGCCHLYCILRLSDILSSDILPDAHICGHHIPESVHLFNLRLCQSVQPRVEVLTQQFIEPYLLLELQAQSFQCLHSILP